MPNILNDFDPSQFLRQYWQKRPLLIKRFFSDFEDLLDEHDLAGIAQEPEVDSRIVSQDNAGNWRNTAGPFNDFESVCVDAWSLLVQGTERYIPEIDELFEQFAFVPYWRMDDVMVSYSVPGAGVGAHIDQYDVFLIQGKGKRRWQIGKPGGFNEVDNNGLRQISNFEPIIDVVTGPGDVIYIPPGWPHKGETLEDSLTYSIGFRAPDTEQITHLMIDTLHQSDKHHQRFSDPDRVIASQPAVIERKDINHLKRLITDLIETDSFETQLLSMLSDCHIEIESESDAISIEQLKSELAQGAILRRREGIKPVYVGKQVNEGKPFTFYLNGEKFESEHSAKSWLEQLLNCKQFVLDRHVEAPPEAFFTTVEKLLECGYYAIE